MYFLSEYVCPSHYPSPDKAGGDMCEDDITSLPKMVKLQALLIIREITQTQRKIINFNFLYNSILRVMQHVDVTTFTQQHDFVTMYTPGMTEIEGSILSTVLSKTLFPRDRVFRNCFSSSLITSITWKMHTVNHIYTWGNVTAFVYLTLHHATLTLFNDWWVQIHVCINMEAMTTLPPPFSLFLSLSLSPSFPPSLSLPSSPH